MRFYLRIFSVFFSIILAVAGRYNSSPNSLEQENLSSWKTFSNQKYKIEFKYPAIWAIQEKRDRSEWVVTAASKGELYSFTVRVGDQKSPSYIFASGITQTVQIAGVNHTAYVFSKDRCPQQATECPVFYIPILFKDKWYLLEGRRGIEDNRIAESSVYPAILASLRFIDD